MANGPQCYGGELPQSYGAPLRAATTDFSLYAERPLSHISSDSTARKPRSDGFEAPPSGAHLPRNQQHASEWITRTLVRVKAKPPANVEAACAASARLGKHFYYSVSRAPSTVQEFSRFALAAFRFALTKQTFPRFVQLEQPFSGLRQLSRAAAATRGLAECSAASAAGLSLSNAALLPFSAHFALSAGGQSKAPQALSYKINGRLHSSCRAYFEPHLPSDELSETQALSELPAQTCLDEDVYTLAGLLELLFAASVYRVFDFFCKHVANSSMQIDATSLAHCLRLLRHAR